MLPVRASPRANPSPSGLGIPFLKWAGATVVCIASGPSLSAEDCDSVRLWRDASPADRKAVVVNTSFRAAPWADALFAMDIPWWHHHIKEIRESFHGEPCSSSPHALRYGVRIIGSGWNPYGNSGAGAIRLACCAGATRVLLIGYDCKPRGAQIHWHADHPKPLGNAGSMMKWAGQFAKLRDALTGVEIINCSRDTALTAFSRGDLGQELSRSATPHEAAQT